MSVECYRSMTRTALPQQIYNDIHHALDHYAEWHNQWHSQWYSNQQCSLAQRCPRPPSLHTACSPHRPNRFQILLKTHAIAINPVDAKMQSFALFPLSFPVVLGEDVAGEVVSVGEDVTRFKPGDRIIGCCCGIWAKSEAEKAFQEYVVVRDNMACEIPGNMAFEDAVVLPLGMSTAASGLYHPDYLNLALPTVADETRTENSGCEGRGTLLVWGGASSVGSNAIQLGVAS